MGRKKEKKVTENKGGRKEGPRTWECGRAFVSVHYFCDQDGGLGLTLPREADEPPVLCRKVRASLQVPVS